MPLARTLSVAAVAAVMFLSSAEARPRPQRRVTIAEHDGDHDEVVYGDGTEEGKIYDDADEYNGSFDSDGACDDLEEVAHKCLFDHGGDVSTCFPGGPDAWANALLAAAGSDATVSGISGAKYHKATGEYCVSFKPVDLNGEVECPETGVECAV